MNGHEATPPLLGGPWSGLEFPPPNIDSLLFRKLPILQTPEDLCRLLSVDEEKLANYTVNSIASPRAHYDHFSIPKRRGGTRLISTPNKPLQAVLRQLNAALFSKIEVDYVATAFGAGSSTKWNAAEHTHRDLLVKLDLRDFFGSIRFPRVKSVLQERGYASGIVTLLALLTTVRVVGTPSTPSDPSSSRLMDRSLPQGAATSPHLSNIVCLNLDRRLTAIAEDAGFAYTRYADDLTFSNCRVGYDEQRLLRAVGFVVADEGFELNPTKVRVIPRTRRQIVTGLVVNGNEPTIPRGELRRFRAFLHRYQRDHRSPRPALGPTKEIEDYLNGYLSYVRWVSDRQLNTLIRSYPWVLEKPALKNYRGRPGQSPPQTQSKLDTSDRLSVVSGPRPLQAESGEPTWGSEWDLSVVLSPRGEAIQWARDVIGDTKSVFLDTETTGLGPEAEIIDIAIVALDGSLLFESLVKPRRPIPAAASVVHGITNDRVARAPSWQEAYAEIVTHLCERRIVVYNAEFDRKMVAQCCTENGLSLVGSPWQCAMLAYAKFKGEINPRFGDFRWHKLDVATRDFGLQAGGHRAAADSQACRLVVLKMAEASL